MKGTDQIASEAADGFLFANKLEANKTGKLHNNLTAIIKSAIEKATSELQQDLKEANDYVRQAAERLRGLVNALVRVTTNNYESENGFVRITNETLRVCAAALSQRKPDSDSTGIEPEGGYEQSLPKSIQNVTLPRLDSEPAATPSGGGQQMFYCDKCGYYGNSSKHDACNYFAEPAQSRDCGNDTKRLDWLETVEGNRWLLNPSNVTGWDMVTIRQAIDAAMQETHRGESASDRKAKRDSNLSDSDRGESQAKPPACALCGKPPHPDSYGHSYRPRKET